MHTLLTNERNGQIMVTSSRELDMEKWKGSIYEERKNFIPFFIDINYFNTNSIHCSC